LSARAGLVALGLLLASCISPIRLAEPLFQSSHRVEKKIANPVRNDARLAVLWVGHASLLIQLDDRLVMTDPVFTSAVGQMSKRLVEPGLDVENVPRLDAVLISHMHYDHLSLGSLELLENRIGRLYMPRGGTVYLTDFSFANQELGRWQSVEDRGMRITAVPVEHNGMRYGIDVGWMTHTFTGYVVEYRGVTVYFGGDSAYGPHYRETRKRFPRIDLALLPIAPIEPRSFMKKTHMDPKEALHAFQDLGAKTMVPIHYDTFVNSQDLPGDALAALERERRAQHIESSRLAVLGIGEQRVFLSHR
jgi:N-acyl-phosphatidylethanolamine-hydrolysing phospholipase D